MLGRRHGAFALAPGSKDVRDEVVGVRLSRLLLSFGIGFTLWVAYGISEHNLVLIVPNSASWLVGTSTIVIARRFGRGRAHEAAEAG